MYHTALRTVSAIAIAAALETSPANAADLGAQEEEAQLREAGYRNPVWQGFYASLGAGYEIFVLDEAGPFGVDLSEDDFFGNGRLGYDAQRGRFVAGPFIEASYSGLDVSEWTYAFGGRAGVTLGNTLFYGLAKYDFRELDGISDDLEGFAAGGGVEAHLGGPVFGGLEYTHHFGEEIGEFDTSVDAVKAQLTIKGNVFE